MCLFFCYRDPRTSPFHLWKTSLPPSSSPGLGGASPCLAPLVSGPGKGGRSRGAALKDHVYVLKILGVQVENLKDHVWILKVLGGQVEILWDQVLV